MFSLGRSIAQTVARGARGGLGGFGQSVRFYNSYDVLMLPPFLMPKNVAGAEAAARSMLVAAYDQGFFQRRLDPGGNPILRLVLGPEFALNGYRDGDTYRYDASRHIDRERFEAVQRVLVEYAPQIDPSVVMCPGTAAVDTGQEIEGKRVLENRSLLVQGTNGLSEAEAQNNLVPFSKQLQSHIDLPEGYEQAFTMRPGEGAGPLLVSIKDFTGGRAAVVALAICLDLTALGNVAFPIDPQLVLNPSAGSPIDTPVGPAEIVVVDTLRAPFDSEAIVRSRVYEPKTGLAEAFPRFKTFFDGLETVVGEGTLADVARDALGRLVLSPGEQFDTVMRFKPLNNMEIVTSKTGQEMVKTEQRHLPDFGEHWYQKLQDQIKNPDSSISVIFPDGATVETGSDVPPPPEPGQGIEGFDPNQEEAQVELHRLAEAINVGT